MQITALQKRWRALCGRLGGHNDTEMDRVSKDLMRRYTEPNRHYHDMHHIMHCLNELDSAAEYLPLDQVSRDLTEIALWFHDSIYLPKSKYSEEWSARYAAVSMVRMGIPDEYVRAVDGLIRATKTHESTHLFSHPLLDIDLSIFGRPKDEFDEYERGIRREYAFVPKREFRMGRVAVLTRYLNRPTIYRTEYFLKKYERSARANLERSLKALGSRAA